MQAAEGWRYALSLDSPRIHLGAVALEVGEGMLRSGRRIEASDVEYLERPLGDQYRVDPRRGRHERLVDAVRAIKRSPWNWHGGVWWQFDIRKPENDRNFAGLAGGNLTHLTDDRLDRCEVPLDTQRPGEEGPVVGSEQQGVDKTGKLQAAATAQREGDLRVQAVERSPGRDIKVGVTPREQTFQRFVGVYGSTQVVVLWMPEDPAAEFHHHHHHHQVRPVIARWQEETRVYVPPDPEKDVQDLILRRTLLGYVTATRYPGGIAERGASIWYIRQQTAGQADALLKWMLPRDLVEPAPEDIDNAALLGGELPLVHHRNVLRKQMA
jgi:hypothetical protein